MTDLFKCGLCGEEEETVSAFNNHTCEEKKGMDVTEKEMAVLKVIANCMNDYQDGFSDIMFEDIGAETGFPNLTVRGVLGSLDKKGLIDYMDVNGEYNVYYVVGEAAEELLDFDLNDC